MSLPPPSDPYGPGPSGSPPSGPPPGHPYGSSPQWGPSPPMPVPGQPPHVPGGPQWGHPAQSGWPPPPPQRRGSGIKWLLLAVALLLVIAISVGATLLFTRDGGGGSPPTASPPTSGPTIEIASADDTGPVAIITEDPTCDAWTPIQATLVQKLGTGWKDRDWSTPESDWSPEQRSQYEFAGSAFRDAATQTTDLPRMTPHRVVRELYEQFIAYALAYSDKIPTYTAIDDWLVDVANTTTGALGAICSAIDSGSAAARAPFVPEGSPPTRPAAVGNVNSPQRFLLEPNAVCADWRSAAIRFDDATTAWRTVSIDLPTAAWTAGQRTIIEEALPVLGAYANTVEILGRASNNPTLEDFAALSAQYRRAYIAAVPTYTQADGWLIQVAGYSAKAVNSACKAVED